jgi:predicted RNase H-like nuclease (RuvC/YqgF family)
MMNEENELTNISSEPIALIPQIVGFRKVAGDQKTADHAAWLQDMADRQKRTQELEAKRQANKPQEPRVELSAIDEALSALDAAATDFENSHLKPNLQLIESRNEVERLKFELSAAEAKLAEVESRGDSVQRLTDSVKRAESQLQSLVSKAESEEILRLAHAHYGWAIGWDKVSSDMKRDFRNHASVMAFKSFYVQRSIVNPGQTPSVESLQQKLQIVGTKLTELRDHIAGETEE